MRWISLLALMFTIASPVSGSGKKPEKIILSFHLEGQKTDNPKMIFPAQAPGGVKYFQRTAVARTKEITAFKPFAAKDGSAGATFQLSKVAKRRLEAVTTESRGKWMMAVVNGQPTNVVYIDNPVRDGILVIWSGLKQSQVNSLDFKIPRIGETPAQWKARKAALKKRLPKK